MEEFQASRDRSNNQTVWKVSQTYQMHRLAVAAQVWVNSYKDRSPPRVACTNKVSSILPLWGLQWGGPSRRGSPSAQWPSPLPPSGHPQTGRMECQLCLGLLCQPCHPGPGARRMKDAVRLVRKQAVVYVIHLTNTTLHYTTPHHTTLHYITLHHIS